MKFLTPFTKSPTSQDVGSQTFNQDEAAPFGGGKPIKIRDYVAENAEGTDFYENLEKFGNLETTIEFMSRKRTEIIEDFEEAVTLRNLEDRRIKMEKIFYSLPPEVRGQFNNSFQEFLDKGDSFIENLKEQQNVQKPNPEPAISQTEAQQGNNSNQNSTEKS